jgi:hypothetical protein
MICVWEEVTDIKWRIILKWILELLVSSNHLLERAKGMSGEEPEHYFSQHNSSLLFCAKTNM